jgi:hypothetical protein
MNKAQIFFTFRESSTLESTINQIPGTADYSQKIISYSTTKGQQFVKFHNKYLDVRDCQLFTLQQYLPRYIFVLIQTKTNTNHPYLLFFNLDDIYITFLIPFGGDYKQADSSTYWGALDEANQIELTAIYILLEKTIYIRKLGIVDSRQFSLINCSNISNCIKKMREIDKMRVGASEKQELRARYSEYYLHKAIDFLKYYFDLLENKNFDEAQLFLKGGDSKHFGKQRLNTFFKNTKSIIGHLEIFISIYELYHESRMMLFRQ